MLNQMPYFKRKTLRVILKLNKDPIREMTICHAPQREDKDPSGPRLQGFLS